MPTLVKLNTNWADEMDIEGFVITLDSKEKVMEMLKHDYMQRTIYDNIKKVEMSAEDLKIYNEAQKRYKPCTITISKKSAEMLLQEPIEICVGTNQEIGFDNFKAYLDEHKIQEISNEEYETLKKLLGESYANAPRFNDNDEGLTINIS